ncbi:Xyloglucan endotransglucosylase/hydrolase [Rhynchospora pubera]|uniref:Xyloglucan endotransglucosylase/hydrolase n=1 Tax=Rhynchospora pubera TaxID=906938 RepID=A0AAV8DX46_9POAL|nr:Xyloglucan endotransglucosylase/hydrolase [Rhynchospora pubera]
MATAKVLFSILASLLVLEQALALATFDTDTVCIWGEDNCQIHGDNLTLILNQWSGITKWHFHMHIFLSNLCTVIFLAMHFFSGAAVKGTKEFLFGYVSKRIKLVPDNSAAVVTTYYASSPWVSTENDTHDEIDFEFLGNVTGEPYTIHTNIFVNGIGNKEEQFKPWFDPTSDYHNYTIFWSPYVVVWSIDDIVLRVFKNNEDKGIPFPKTRPMTVYSSIWNADDWACQGGQVKTNWTHQPFIARYLNYEDSVCLWTGTNSIQDCSAVTPENWYMAPQFRQLAPSQIDNMNDVRSYYMIYDYFSDTKRFNGAMPQEC